MKLAPCVALALFAVSPAFAQPAPPVALQVGDARLEAARLQPYRARWKETLVNAVHQVIERGTWAEELVRESREGRDVFVRSLVVTSPDGTERERYRVVVDARTFAPLRSEWSSAGKSYEYDYDGTSVRGVRVNEGGAEPVRIAATLPQPAFDYYGGLMELFLALLPNAPGARFTFPAALSTSGALADQSGLHWPLVEVFAEEAARGAAGAVVRARRLEANTQYGFYKVWVIDAPPYVVRTVLLLPPGGRITYELLP